MKKIHSMMLMLLVAVMSLCVQSCGSDDDNTPSSPMNNWKCLRTNSLKLELRNISMIMLLSKLPELQFKQLTMK